MLALDELAKSDSSYTTLHARLILARPDAGDLEFAEAVGVQPRLRRVRFCRLGAQLDVHRVLRPLVAAAPVAAARGRQQTAQRQNGRLHLRGIDSAC